MHTGSQSLLEITLLLLAWWWGGGVLIPLPKYLPGCLPSHSTVSEWHGVDQCHCHPYETFPVYKEFG